jgi:hypothetical protein
MRSITVDRNSVGSKELAPEEAISISPPRRSTGPRTTRGKARSRYNSQTHGIFSKAIVLEGERRSEYNALLTGLYDDYQPQGTSEKSLVEWLATLWWRRNRVLHAERAEIAKASESWEHALDSRLQIDAEEKNQLAKREGGLLRFRSNPYVLDIAIDDLEILRKLVEEQGPTKALSKAILTKLEGRRLEGDPTPDWLQDHFTILGLQNIEERRARIYSELREYRKENTSAQDCAVDLLDAELKDRYFKDLDKFIDELKRERDARGQVVYRQAMLDAESAVVPASEVLDRIPRYEAHISREIDRTQSQLERLQRMRLGQAVPSPLKVELSG